MRDWHQKIWKKRFPAEKKSLLVLDSYSAHMCEDTTTEFDLNATKAVAVPGGCTPLVQPLDKCINHPFKVQLRKLWHDWMVAQVESHRRLNPNERKIKIPKPTKQQLVDWVVEAWKLIPEEVVVKSFKVCGISNALDGSESNLTSVDFSRFL